MTDPTTASERRFSRLYWPYSEKTLQAVRDHAHACRLRADAGDASWGRLAAFHTTLTRRSLPDIEERPPPGEERGYSIYLSDRQPHGTTAALCEWLHDLIMEGVE